MFLLLKACEARQCTDCLVAGGLLSSHIMLERMPSAVPGYDGALLRLATDLGNRLLPAFDTKSGIPLSWVHLQKVREIAGETFAFATLSVIMISHLLLKFF